MIEYSENHFTCKMTTLFSFANPKAGTSYDCTKCGEPMGDAIPDWQKYCSHCYSEYQDQLAAAPMRKCVTCKEETVSSLSPDWKTECRECFEKGKDAMRACNVCAYKKIHPSRPGYVKMCGDCWKDSIENGRLCPECKVNNIGACEPMWKKKCRGCFKKGRQLKTPIGK